MNCLMIICSYYLMTSEGRLVERTTKKETTFADSLTFGLKVRRASNGEQVLTGLYQEDDNEMFKTNNKLGHNYGPFMKSFVRMPRDSKETHDKERNNSTEISKEDETDDARKNMVVLVKKPIPKFKSMDYEEDFQMRPNKVPIFLDSVEHEDEDFNVDDYDFDVNHDEFSGRGKPLEPRAKVNNNKEKNEKLDMALKSYGKPKVLPPLIKNKVSGKNQFYKQEGREKIMKRLAIKYKDNEYYDDTTTEKSGDKQNKDAEDDDESVEYDAKATIKVAVSVQKDVNTNFLGVLPMFP